MKNDSLVKISLQIAKLRKKDPIKAKRLEQALFTTMQDISLPESETRYLLELTIPRIYQ